MLIPAVATRSTSIVVSGFPPFAATAYLVEGRLVGVASCGSKVPWLTGPRPPEWSRCRRCNRTHQGAPHTHDLRLGWSGWCPICMTELLAECHAQNGRLPSRGEFYCPKCRGILYDALRGPRDSQTGIAKRVCIVCYRRDARDRRRRLVARRRAIA